MILPRSVEEFIVLALHKRIFWKQAQALADRLSEMGLSLDKLALLPLNDFLGVATLLNRKFVVLEE